MALRSCQIRRAGRVVGARQLELDLTRQRAALWVWGYKPDLPDQIGLMLSVRDVEIMLDEILKCLWLV